MPYLEGVHGKREDHEDKYNLCILAEPREDPVSGHEDGWYPKEAEDGGFHDTECQEVDDELAGPPGKLEGRTVLDCCIRYADLGRRAR